MYMYIYMYLHVSTYVHVTVMYIYTCVAVGLLKVQYPIRNEDCGVHNYASAVVISPGTVGRAPA